jgi:phosphatidylglycerol---prolipoprotein diacylglyceryl transferase
VHPVLFEGPLGWTANAYGTLILLGTLATVPGAVWDARRRRLGALFLLDVYVGAIVGAVLGGEILHIVTRADQFAAMPGRLESGEAFGLVYYGSLLGMFVAMTWVARKHARSNAEVIGFVLTWGLPAHVLGRVGCYLAGCCWGAPSDAAWAVRFPEGAIVWSDPGVAHVGARTIALHPVQLYEAAGLAALMVVMVGFRLRRGPETSWHGQPARWAIGYGLLRFCTEVFRADPDRRQLLELPMPTLAKVLALPADHPILLSTSQAISVVLVVGALVLIRRARVASPMRG